MLDIMVRSKQLPETFGKKTEAACDSLQSLKEFSEEFETSHSTVRKTVYQWWTSKNNCQHAKVWLSQQIYHKMIKEISKID